MNPTETVGVAALGVRIPPEMRALLPYFEVTTPTVGGISGGRTSALMHVLSLEANASNDLYYGVFANTGKEHEQTLVFLRNLEAATGVPLAWVEFRAPVRYAAAPKEARYFDVDFVTADRIGRPFEEFLRTLAEFRLMEKGKPPVVPGFNMRVCTAYMKVRTMHRWALDHIGDEYDKFIGLRADEPTRVARIGGQDRGGVRHLTPLAMAKITKADVLSFWSEQDFDLGIPEHLGNCNKCYLKDEADLAQSMYEEPDDVPWWLALQDRFGDFRRGRTTMRTIFAEAATRMEVIRPAVRAGLEPVRPEGFDAYRWKLLVRQERKRVVTGPAPFSCACESAQLSIFDGDDDA